MTGNVPSYLHSPPSLPNSRDKREDGDGRRGYSGGRLREMKGKRDRDGQGWKLEDKAHTVMG